MRRRRITSRMLPAAMAVALGGCYFAQGAVADQWGHWRGPDGNSVAADAKPPVQWSEGKNIRWKVEVPGRGSGSPVVWNDRVFVTTSVPSGNGQAKPAATEPPAQQPADEGGRGRRRGGRGGGGGFPGRGQGGGPQIEPLDFKLLCFNRQTGELLWSQTAVTATPHEGTHSTNSFASASPCTDGEHVYAHFGSQGLYCYTMDGELVWQRDFGDMTCRNGFGEGSSPTLVDDMIIVPWDHEGPSFLYALNKKTGEILWQTARDEPTCWATPLICEFDGKRQIVMNGQNMARSYDLATGKELWRCGGQTQRPAATAVAGNGLIYVGSGFQGSFLAAFRPNGRGDVEGTDAVAWSVDRDTPDVPSPVLSGDRLYFYKGRNGVLTCLNAVTGEPYYSAVRVPGITSVYATPVVAGGHVYLADREGNVVVIEDAAEFKVVATNSMGETIDASPAPVDDQLFIRTDKHLVCIGE